MTTFTATTTVEAPAEALFEYLSEVSNLPEYFPSMTSARSVDGGKAVHTTAELDDGTKHEGTAWFETEEDANSIRWGSEGDNDYHGELEVTSTGDSTSTVEITLHTDRKGADDDLESSLQDVLDTIKQIVEKNNA